MSLRSKRRQRAQCAYQEVGEDGAPAFAPHVGTLYVRKSAMPGGNIPKKLSVIVKGE